ASCSAVMNTWSRIEYLRADGAEPRAQWQAHDERVGPFGLIVARAHAQGAESESFVEALGDRVVRADLEDDLPGAGGAGGVEQVGEQRRAEAPAPLVREHADRHDLARLRQGDAGVSDEHAVEF